FNGEIAIHFPGLEGLQKPIVWVFQELRVCLDCGFTEFKVPERELSVLTDGKPVKGALVFAKAREAVSTIGPRRNHFATTHARSMLPTGVSRYCRPSSS